MALAIVTLGVAAMLGSMTSAADNAYYLRDKTFAEWVALNRITEVRLSQGMPKKGKTDGEIEMGGRKWIWQQEVLPMELDGMFQISVSVRPQRAGESTTGSSDAKRQDWYTTVNGIIGDAVIRGRNDSDALNMGNGFVGPKPQNGQGGEQPPPKDDDGEEETGE